MSSTQLLKWVVWLPMLLFTNQNDDRQKNDEKHIIVFKCEMILTQIHVSPRYFGDVSVKKIASTTTLTPIAKSMWMIRYSFKQGAWTCHQLCQEILIFTMKSFSRKNWFKYSSVIEIHSGGFMTTTNVSKIEVNAIYFPYVSIPI